MSFGDHEEIKFKLEKKPEDRAFEPSTHQVLSGLALKYKDASGRAFALGQDDVASAMREASQEIERLAKSLPSLPSQTTVRPR